jgi:Protein of unknown function DUF262
VRPPPGPPSLAVKIIPTRSYLPNIRDTLPASRIDLRREEGTDATVTKLGAILDQIDSGTTLLPEFQRGYVWNRDQVRGLMRSLYRGYPVGGLLVWEAETDAASVRGSSPGSGVKQLLLDGQQRVTSLYGIVRGRPPEFFEGDPAAFTGLRFNVEDETFEFFAPAKMRDDPRWVNVTSLFINGLELEIAKLNKAVEIQPKIVPYMTRLARLRGVLDREFHIEKITGADKTVDVVVDIFNRVNAGGTKLSKGDLALAKICAQWPEARGTMRGHLARWREAGYAFSLDWLLRNANAVATGRAPFSALEDITTQQFQHALTSSAKYVGGFLDAVCGRLGLDHDRVLMGRYAFPVVSRFLHLSGGHFADAAERDQMLYWYVQTALWGRFTGSTETVLAQDYETLEKSGIDGLVTAIERARGGNLTIGGHDFEGFGRGSRFYPLLYLLTRVRGARDFGTGLELKREMLGHLTSLQVHHIFPMAYLYNAGYTRGQVNAVANFCFLTQETNLTIGQRAPEAYLVEVEAKHPGTLASQWVPADPSLWKPARYLDFLAARRQLLADAANGFLAELRSGAAAPSAILLERLEVSSEDVEVDERVMEVKRLVEELTALGYGEPACDAEIADPVDGHVLAVAEAVWPEGLQTGQGNPIVLELDPADADLPRLEELGYEVFTNIESLRGYAWRRNEVAAGLLPEEGPVPVRMSDTVGEPESTRRSVDDFESAMRALYHQAKDEAGYTATYFLGMLAQHGGMETAHRLLAATKISDGFTALWERQRLDLTVEAVVRPEFQALFSDEEVETARRRLEQFGYQT